MAQCSLEYFFSLLLLLAKIMEWTYFFYLAVKKLITDKMQNKPLRGKYYEITQYWGGGIIEFIDKKKIEFISNPSSSPEQSCLHFSSHLYFWNLSPSIKAWVDNWANWVLSSFGKTICLRERKLWIQTSNTLLKNWLCVCILLMTSWRDTYLVTPSSSVYDSL